MKSARSLIDRCLSGEPAERIVSEGISPSPEGPFPVSKLDKDDWRRLLGSLSKFATRTDKPDVLEFEFDNHNYAKLFVGRVTGQHPGLPGFRGIGGGGVKTVPGSGAGKWNSMTVVIRKNAPVLWDLD